MWISREIWLKVLLWNKHRITDLSARPLVLCIYPFWKKKYTIESDVYAYRHNLNGITYKSRGNVKSIDHYWIMLYLWDWIKDKQILRSDEWLQISMLDTMVLGCSRTKDLDEETVQSGFVVLRQRYLSSFANPPRQQNKYKLITIGARPTVLNCKRKMNKI